MKKTAAIIGIIVLAAGASFAKGPRGGNDFGGGFGSCLCGGPSSEKGRGRGHKGMGGGMGMHGGMAMGGGMMGMHGGGMRNFDETQVTAFLKAQGMSDADITKAMGIQKEKTALMERYWESSMRQNMKDRGMSDADITRFIQLQKDARALQDKYNTPSSK